jgi:galactokinase
VRAGDWGDYVRGVTVALREAGVALGGFEARVASEIPPGAGLASSAALCVALLRAIRVAFALALDDLALAHLAQRAEHAIPGAPVGIMDPMAACFAGVREAIFLDTRALTWERVPLPEGVELVVLDSGERHENVAAGYRTRRAECERAAELLGVATLREAQLKDAARLPAPLDRRTRHVVTENARVEAAVRALRTNDVAALGALLDASHASLRDDFEVSTPTIDRLVARTRADRSVLGVRLTGGGFGGSIVALARTR